MLRDAEGDKCGAALITEDMNLESAVPHERQYQGCTARARAQHDIRDARPEYIFREHVKNSVHQRGNTLRMVLIFISVSFHSAPGSESAVTPAPA